MSHQAHETHRPQRARRSDAGRIRLGQRDIDGLTLLAQSYAAPCDLLARALGVTIAVLLKIIARWRTAGLAESDRLATGPGWCWLTPAGMDRTGYPWHAAPPHLARLAHIRAVLAVRLWLTAGDAYRDCRARWISERHLRAALPRNTGLAHLADAEIHWPLLDGSPYAGQAWAIECELTPKTLGRTQEIISGLLARPYAQVVYLVAPPAAPVVARAVERFPGQADRLTVRSLPPAALMPPAPAQPGKQAR